MAKAKKQSGNGTTGYDALLAELPNIDIASLSKVELLQRQVALEMGTKDIEAEIASRIEDLNNKLSNVRNAEAMFSQELIKRLGGAQATVTPTARTPNTVSAASPSPTRKRAPNKTEAQWAKAALDMLNGFSDGIQKSAWLEVVKKKSGRDYTNDYQAICNLLSGKDGPKGIKLKPCIKSNGKVGILGAWNKVGAGANITAAKKQLKKKLPSSDNAVREGNAKL